MVYVIHHICRVEPGEVEGEINGTSDGHNTEEIVQNMALLSSQHQAKLTLLEAVNLDIKVWILVKSKTEGNKFQLWPLSITQTFRHLQNSLWGENWHKELITFQNKISENKPEQ